MHKVCTGMNSCLSAADVPVVKSASFLHSPQFWWFCVLPIWPQRSFLCRACARCRRSPRAPARGAPLSAHSQPWPCFTAEHGGRRKNTQTRDFSLESKHRGGRNAPTRQKWKQEPCLSPSETESPARARAATLTAVSRRSRTKKLGKVWEKKCDVSRQKAPLPLLHHFSISRYNSAITFQLSLAPVRELTRGRHRVLSADVHWRQSREGVICTGEGRGFEALPHFSAKNSSPGRPEPPLTSSGSVAVQKKKNVCFLVG